MARSKAEVDSKLGNKLLMLSGIELQIWTSTFAAEFKYCRNRVHALTAAESAVAAYQMVLQESGSVFEYEYDTETETTCGS